MIYEFCLVVEDVIEPYPPKWAVMDDLVQPQHKNLPALLQVNKLIGAEARETLYLSNNWRVPIIDTLDSTTIFHLNLELFRSITMAFDSRDLAGSVRARISRDVHLYDYHNYTNPDGRRAREVHARLQSEMIKIWEQASILVKDYMKHARTVTIDVGGLACPSGCCRLRLFRRAAPFHAAFLIDLRPKHMAKRAKKGQPLPRVVIKGCLNETERTQIRDDLGFADENLLLG